MKAGEAVVDSVSAAISQALRSDVLQQISPPISFLSLRLTLPVWLCFSQAHNLLLSPSFVSLSLSR